MLSAINAAMFMGLAITLDDLSWVTACTILAVVNFTSCVAC